MYTSSSFKFNELIIPGQLQYRLFPKKFKGIAGTRLDQQFLDKPDRPVDQLLRWHFRQAVLANMRGAGEPMFESDFPPGSDMAGEVRNGPKAAERMEFELFSRLAMHDHVG
jgi:hypothetical protein